MLLALALSLAVAGDYDDAEATRFSGLQADPGPAEGAAPWRGGARSDLSDVVAVETQLHALGATPEQTVLVSAQLDWGPMQRTPSSESLSFTGAGVTVRARRLSDGAVLREGTVVDEHGTYDLSDPKQRSRLCTRAAAGQVGELKLHTWTGDAAPARDASFLMVEGEQRTAVVDLEPGESATVVEVVSLGKRSPKVKRALTVQHGDKVLTLTEGDVLQRVCLDF